MNAMFRADLVVNSASNASSIPCAPAPLLLAAAPDTDRAAEIDHARWFRDEVEPHTAALRAYLRGRFPDLTEIDDLVQETVARLLRAHARGKLDGVRPFLFSTARHAAIDLMRRRQIVRFERIGDNELSAVVEEQPDVAEIVSRDQERAILHEAIATLPPRCREVLTLRRFHGLSHREIATRLRIAEKTVEAQLCIAVHRCREFLRSRGVFGSGSDTRGFHSHTIGQI